MFRTHETNESEAARLRAVERYRLVERLPDEIFGRIGGLAARFFDSPMATVFVAARDTIWLAAIHGVDGVVEHIPRHDALVAHLVEAGGPCAIDDALADPRTGVSDFARQHGIRFVAGAPIVTFDGHCLGALAVMDTQSRTADPEQLAVLTDLAAIVMDQLELRLSSLDAVLVERQLRGFAEVARDEARRGRSSAEHDRDEAQRDRDDAESDRDEARLNRDDAVRDRDIAERDRDLIEQYATVLQGTLLPPVLPDIDGLSLASFYQPVSPREVGGDFYDVFPIASGRWAFFIGDVLGHGAEAAVVTSLIRYTLRAAALHFSDLTEALDELNSVLLREAKPRRFCTVMFGTLERDTESGSFSVSLATGGHPPALLIDSATKRVEQVRPQDGMLVGALPDATFDSCRVDLRPGQTLLFYTDGLIETRPVDRPFVDRDLAEFAGEHAARGAAGLVDDLAVLIAKLDARDDIAVMALGATAAEAEYSAAGRGLPTA